MTDVDTIGGFPIARPYCLGCGEPLLVENAWMTDGCQCNSKLGVNNQNETRWRLLMTLQQRQSRENESLRKGDNLHIRAGEGRVQINTFSADNGHRGLIFRDTGEPHPVGEYVGDSEEKNYTPNPGEICLLCSNVESAIVVREMLDKVINDWPK